MLRDRSMKISPRISIFLSF